MNLYTKLHENFGEYCEKGTGFKRAQVYNYISVVENLPEDFVYSSRQIGIKKLTLLTQLSDEERTQITENTDLESTTVKELKAQIDSVKKHNDALHEEMRYREEEAEIKTEKLKNKIADLTEQVKELESRPIDIPPETDSKEVADLKDAMKRVDLEWGERYSELQEQNFKERRELLQKANQAEQDKQEQLAKLNKELEKTKAEYEKKLAETPTKTDDKATFKAYLATALDGVKRLCEYVKNNSQSENYSFFKEKSVSLAEIIKKELED